MCRSVEDAQAETQRLKECDLDRRELSLLRDQIANKDEKIANLEEKLRLKTEESAIKDEMMKVKDQMIANQQANFEQMKDVADRAIKLVEVNKPSVFDTIWKVTIGVAIGLAIAAVVAL